MPLVDRKLAKLIAMKRIVTGSVSILFAAGIVVVGATKGTSPLLFLAVAVFLVTGAWALRDGFRLKRELER